MTHQPASLRARLSLGEPPLVSISIIIPAINEAHVIGDAVRRAWQAGADEVVVADGGSVDQTTRLATDEGALVADSALGRGQQLNAGAGMASGDVLLFLHADNWLVAGGCQQIRDAMVSGNVQFGAFEQRIENPRLIYRWIETGNRWRVTWRGLIYGDQGLFIRRELFKSLKGFPEIPIMEDLAFSRILKRQGRAVLLPGPTHVSARRWQHQGPVRQTLRNWYLSTAFLLGASPESLSQKYRRHDAIEPPDDPRTPTGESS